MKELKDIAWNISEKEYRADSALSQSTLAKFYREGFSSLDKLFEKTESPSLTFGSMVDTLITGSIEEFNERFVLVQDFGLSDTLRQITKSLYDIYKGFYNSLEDIPDQILSDVAVNCGYYTDAKYYNVRVKKVKECSPYYDELKRVDRKTPVTQLQYNDAFDCVRILKTSPNTERYFSEGTETFKPYYQLKFKGEYNDIPLRGMLDLVWVNYEDKIIYPFDLKTSSKKEYEFPLSFMQWSYMIQASLYTELVTQAIAKDDYFKDFEIANFQFITINNTTRTPLVWEYKGSKAAEETAYGKEGQFKCPSWRKLATELWYYLSEKPRVPIDIKVDEPNDIIEWLNKYNDI